MTTNTTPLRRASDVALKIELGRSIRFPIYFTIFYCGMILMNTIGNWDDVSSSPINLAIQAALLFGGGIVEYYLCRRIMDFQTELKRMRSERQPLRLLAPAESVLTDAQSFQPY